MNKVCKTKMKKIICPRCKCEADAILFLGYCAICDKFFIRRYKNIGNGEKNEQIRSKNNSSRSYTSRS